MNAFADPAGPLSLLAGASDPLPALLAKVPFLGVTS